MATKAVKKTRPKARLARARVRVHTPRIHTVTDWQLAALQVGQSYLVEGEHARLLRIAASHHKRRHPGWDYETKAQPEGRLQLTRTA